MAKLRHIKQALSLNPTPNCIIGGWIKSFRPYKMINFIDLVDGTTQDHLQVVVKRDLLDKPCLGSYIRCQGNLVKSAGQQQSTEFKVEKILSASACDPAKYPMIVDGRSTKDGWYRQYPHLRPRVPHFTSLLRIRSELELSLHMILKQMDFFKVQTPVLTSNDSEATSDLFEVSRRTFKGGPSVDDDTDSTDVESSCDIKELSSQVRSSFFGKEVFLTTSAQLHLESLAAALSRVYCLNSAFRAENSIGQRHLCEFLMLEAEEANVDHVGHLMDRVETLIKFVSQYLSGVSEYKADFDFLLDRTSHHKVFDKLAHSSYIRMSYTDAIGILQKFPNNNINFGKDINKTHEKILLEHVDNVPIFITNYPRMLKPFYMKSSGDNVECFDLIAPFGGEICGGSLREDNLDNLKRNLTEIRDNYNKESEPFEQFQWYLQLREFGSFPHGGFGLGIERLIKSLIGIKNIRDTVAFPRTPGSCPM